MFSLTKQERLILVVLSLVLFCGFFLQIIFSTYPNLWNIVNVIDKDLPMKKVDINQADYDDLEALPYIGPYTAKQIILYREKNGRFNSLDELKNISGIKAKNFQRFVGYLIIAGKR